MKKLGKLFKYKLFWLATAALFLLFVWPAKNLFAWLGFGDSDKVRSISARVHSYMATVGTNEKELFAALEPLTKWELERVYKEFGQQPYLLGGGFVGGYSLDLFGWFSKELGKNDRAKMREIWQKTSLEITF